MTDKYFFDTNILVYAHSDMDKSKQKIASEIIENQNEIIISTQVVQEFLNVFITKLKIDIEVVEEICLDIESNFFIHTNTVDTIRKSLKIKKKYGFSIWDSLIISAAIDSGATILLTEDLHNLQKIEGITIQNPFKI
jgi:predicted nucleic acid-binding protein